MPSDPKLLALWNRCEDLTQKLEAAARLKEAEMRRQAAGSDMKAKVTSSYKSAGMVLDMDHLSSFIVQDPIYEKLSLMYCVTVEETSTSFAVLDSPWNTMRRTILRRALQEELYPMFWAEVQDYLMKMSSQVVCQSLRDKLTLMTDVRPIAETDLSLDEAEDKIKQMRQDDDADLSRKREDRNWLSERAARKKGLVSIVVILPEATSETCVVGFVNAFGEPVDMRSVFKRCLHLPRARLNPVEKGSYNDEVDVKIAEHRESLRQLFATYKPAVVLLAISDSNILKMKNDLEDLLYRDQDLLVHFKVLPRIHYVDTTVPRAVAYNKRVMESPAYRDYTIPSHRMAISCARYHQDALAETCQLWHELPDANGILKLALHPLQADVPKEMMGRAITRTLQEVLSKCGLQINKVRRSLHLQSLIQFLPGLGPRKAKLFMKTLANPVTSRQTVVDILAKHLNIQDKVRNSVIENILPFIKIEPDFRDAFDEEYSPSLDRLRISPTFENWVTAFCREALEGQASDLFGESELEVRGTDEEGGANDVARRVIRLMREDPNFQTVLQDHDWSTWPARAGEPNYPECADIDQLFDRVLGELLEPYKDLRPVFADLEGEQLFYLAMGENSGEFKAGCIVRANVL
ncbi:Transcription elongation factor SPT6, partial [Durusdinium trenchii]